jgi:hypothetical protein
MATSDVIIREIVFKKGAEAEAERLCKILDKKSKVLATNERDGHRTMVVQFDDGLDLLAFMCATGYVKYELKERHNGPRHT